MKLSFSLSDARGDVSHGKKILEAWFEQIHDSLRAAHGAYPCSHSFRTYGGTCNNIRNPKWASYHVSLTQKFHSYPTYPPLPNPRTISRTLFHQTASKPSKRRVSMLAVFWGQFVDHDLSHTPDSSNTIFQQSMDISIEDKSDPFHSRHNGKLSFSRSAAALDAGVHHTKPHFPRAQINSVTGYLDASQVYGCKKQRVYNLRTKENGRMLMSRDGHKMLPRNHVKHLGIKLENAGFDSDDHFAAGDIRANEQPVLTALHTLFAREHNRLAASLKKKFKCWSDEKLFQYSRMIVSAQLQHITYNFFVPTFLGSKHGLPPYQGYKKHIDPSISNFFATAAYRFGHSMVADTLTLLNKKHEPHAKNGIFLHQVFFNPQFVHQVGINSLLLGASHQIAETVDTEVVNSLQNELFKSLTNGTDLVALNIQRGRDHGLPLYNDARALNGLSRRTSFAQVTSDSKLQALLKGLYKNVNSVDSFVGGLAEDAVEDSELGPLFSAAIRDQFTRLRDGDRFFFKNFKWPKEIENLKDIKEIGDGSLTLTKIIVRNSEGGLKLGDFGPSVFRVA